jgi:hypothetical protein
MADKNEDPEIKYRKKMTKYIKDSFGHSKLLFSENFSYVLCKNKMVLMIEE